MTEYKIPDAPKGPVKDNYGRVWTRDAGGYWLSNVEAVRWITLLDACGPVREVPQKPTKQDLIKIAVQWESKYGFPSGWTNEVWDLFEPWLKEKL